MAGRATLNVSLTPDLERFVSSKVESGRYESASEVIREGLRLLKERDSSHQADLDVVRQKIASALDQAERGELFDGEEVFRDLLERL